MSSKGRKSKNILNKVMLRQVYGGTFNCKFPRSFMQPNLHLERLCIPLCDIQKDNSFAVGHVLLGFTKCGKYLMSYYKELQDDVSFGIYKYTLHWWKFDLKRPLKQISHVSLFVGEVITEDLLLIVCHSFNDNRVLVHGYGYPGKDEQCKHCYVTICSSPPGNTSRSHDDTWVVHMRYNLLPPFPLFIPQIQVKLRDTLILNTVDSVLAITVSPCLNHKTTKAKCVYETYQADDSGSNNNNRQASCMNRSLDDLKVDTLGKCTKTTLVDNVNDSRFPENEDRMFIIEDVKADGMLSKDNVHKHVEADKSNEEPTNSSCTECNEQGNNSDKSNILKKTLVCDHPIISNILNNNREIHNDIETAGCIAVNKNMPVKDEEYLSTDSKYSHLTSFGFKTFSIGRDSELLESVSTSPVIDGTSYLDIQITTVTDVPYTLLECLQENVELKDHTTPCIHTRVASLDVEKYISEVLNTSNELKGKYWVLKNYSTVLVDVCESSQCVIVHIVILLSVQHNIQTATKREFSPFSLFLTWNIATGEVHTLNLSPLMKTVEKSDRQIFKDGCKIVADLHKKYFVPTGSSSVQVLSNKNVLTGKTLQFIKHPFQSIAIIL